MRNRKQHGVLSEEDKAFIRAHHRTLSVAKIRSTLIRSDTLIRRFLAAEGLEEKQTEQQKLRKVWQPKKGSHYFDETVLKDWIAF